jgi:hypothetical protein
MLPVGVDGDRRAKPTPSRLPEAGENGRSLSLVPGVAQDDSAADRCNVRGGIGGTVVHDDDRNTERFSEIVDDPTYGRGGIEGRNDGARGIHGPYPYTAGAPARTPAESAPMKAARGR